ncbi:unnamed protein product [Gordionus sp. m RMFG-2023]|uniref:long-chain-fatty-acid--CoA ligase ACSBG2-like n=1 Tax=Gordionus sp. m RMFG-2023 TaxID=3053472 RepID=UPI0030DF3D82
MDNLKLAKASSYVCYNPKDPVILRLDQTGDGSLEPITVPERFHQVQLSFPEMIAFKYKTRGEESRDENAIYEEPLNKPWISVTYKEYYQMCRRTARAFIFLGLESTHAVGIIGFNSPEWFYSNFGAIFAGGISTGIYTTNDPDSCLHILNDCVVDIIVVENRLQLLKILKIQDELPSLKAIIQYKGSLKQEAGEYRFKIYSWYDFIKLSSKVNDDELDKIINTLRANMCCTLLYTSGTTGTPKGVMISHDNITWTARQVAKMIKYRVCEEILLSYLPLGHVAAQIVDIYLLMDTANTLYFAHPDVYKGTIVKYLQQVRPTLFVGVPRVYEKIAEKMQEIHHRMTGAKKVITDWARIIGSDGSIALMKGKPLPCFSCLAKVLVFNKVRKALGLDRCTYFVSTGAALSHQTLTYLNSFNIPVMEVYGLNECSGPCTINHPGPGHNWAGSAGLPLIGTHVRISSHYDEFPGELCMSGRNVFMGYINKEKETNEAFNKDGWFKTGDYGKLERTETGGPFVFIKGRIRELIILSGGESVVPDDIENAIKEELKDFISNVMIVGNKKRFLAVLLAIKTEMDEANKPTDIFTPLAKAWLDSVLSPNNNITTLNVLLKSKPVELDNAIQNAINKVNEKHCEKSVYIQKWVFVPRDFSLAGGELGPTLKLRRPVVLKRYSQIIDFIYQDGNTTRSSKSISKRSS